MQPSNGSHIHRCNTSIFRKVWIYQLHWHRKTLPNEDWPTLRRKSAPYLPLPSLFISKSFSPLTAQDETQHTDAHLPTMTDNVTFFTIPLGSDWVTVILKSSEGGQTNTRKSHTATAWLSQVQGTQHLKAQNHSLCKARALCDVNIIMAGPRHVLQAPDWGTCLKITYSSNANVPWGRDKSAKQIKIFLWLHWKFSSN